MGSPPTADWRQQDERDSVSAPILSAYRTGTTGLRLTLDGVGRQASGVSVPDPINPETAASRPVRTHGRGTEFVPTNGAASGSQDASGVASSPLITPGEPRRCVSERVWSSWSWSCLGRVDTSVSVVVVIVFADPDISITVVS